MVALGVVLLHEPLRDRRPRSSPSAVALALGLPAKGGRSTTLAMNLAPVLATRPLRRRIVEDSTSYKT